ncbi:MAG TPA: leucyl aminopeptidase [Pyrinomonadaceae bacterium]|nr:leucyl aminopeptidase [Pyrinomonadaceae bacterium]
MRRAFLSPLLAVFMSASLTGAFASASPAAGAAAPARGQDAAAAQGTSGAGQGATGQSGQDAPERGRVELQVTVDARALAQVEADALAVPVFDGEDPLATVLAGAGAELAAAIRTAAAQNALARTPYSALSFFAPRGFAARRLLLLSAGPEGEFDAVRLRRLAGAAVRQVRGQQVSSLAFAARGRTAAPEAARAVAEGAILGLFDPGLHKTNRTPTPLRALRVAGLRGDAAALGAAVERGLTLAHAANFARSITQEPANFMTPEMMANHARRIAREGGLEVEVFDERQMEAMGMGGVIAVGKGSANPPRFIVLRYRPARPSSVTLALVGKGVTFDSGGISIKPAANMYRMKGDMAGGAAVLGAMQAVSRLRPDVNVLGVVPAVENMPDGRAQKPGDVFTNLSGRTVEVLNTDAEGRLILSDGVTYAVRQNATHIVDIATLTGSVRTALGDTHTGAFASDERFYETLAAASRRSGESFWRLPIDEEYAREIRDSLVADLNETGGLAGASVGAKFIQEFTGGRPWIHLDIAGTSWPESPMPYQSAGPTGVTVRTLAELALLLGSGSPQGGRTGSRE